MPKVKNSSSSSALPNHMYKQSSHHALYSISHEYINKTIAFTGVATKILRIKEGWVRGNINLVLYLFIRIQQ